MSEKIIGIRELKAKISQVIQATRNGESVIITWHGKPLARIIPYQPASESDLDVLMASDSIDWNGETIREINPVGYNSSKTQISDIISDLRE
jgi:prevent-host-death family protein